MNKDLTERVADVILMVFEGADITETAKGAIAIVLEGAARVAEIYEYDELEDDGGAVIKPSAAIRALIK
jgi:hypothetical protein